MADVEELTIGEQIRLARRRGKMSQAELGRRIGISGNAVWRVETGRRGLLQSRLERASQVLGVRFVVGPAERVKEDSG